MASDSNDTNNSNATNELLQNLNAQKEVDTARADAIANEPDEDIDAFLAGLEEGADDASASEASKPAEPDPFADAFAELEEEHGGLVDPLPPVATPEPAAPAPKPVPTPEASAPAPEPEPEESTALEKKKKKAKPTKDQPKVVEGERTAGFKLTMGVLKWTLVLVPTFLLWWVSGSFLGAWFSNGLIVLAGATFMAFFMPLIIKLLFRRGKWAWWALVFSILGLVALILPWPQTATDRMAQYGHWPSTTIAQLAGWDTDHFMVSAHGTVAEFVGHQIQQLVDPSSKPTSQNFALGEEKTLEAIAKEKAAAAKPKETPNTEKASPAKTPKAGPEKKEPKEEAKPPKEAPPTPEPAKKEPAPATP